ncbi:hypothetical protein B296_00018914, partial [Ensete ventricosum]
VRDWFLPAEPKGGNYDSCTSFRVNSHGGPGPWRAHHEGNPLGVICNKSSRKNDIQFRVHGRPPPPSPGTVAAGR